MPSLRELWRAYRGNADVRRLILEVQHGREVLRLIEELRIALDRVVKEDLGGQIAELEQLRVILLRERWRAADML
ncbi:hypothetical protein CUJ88_48965 (plasmid) [Paraburkholderia hospita]|nr:hypothetical protein CUJ88_48965 [Paraburkholderia hospita]